MLAAFSGFTCDWDHSQLNISGILSENCYNESDRSIYASSLWEILLLLPLAVSLIWASTLLLPKIYHLRKKNTPSSEATNQDRIQRALFTSLRLGHVVTNESGIIIKCNHAFLEWQGTTMEQIRAKRFDQIIHFGPGEIQKSLSTFVPCTLYSNKGFPMEMWVYSEPMLSGEPKSIWWVLEPRIGETANKPNRSKKLTYLPQLRSLIESLDAGVIFTDRQGSILSMNKSSKRILGDMLTAITQFGKSAIYTLIRPDGSPASAEDLPGVQALKNGVPSRGQELGIIKQGRRTRWFLFNAQLLYEEDNSVSGVIVSFYETTEKRTERDIRAYYQQQFQSLFEQSGAGMFLMTLDGRIIRTNKTLRNLLGFEEWELNGRHFNEISHPDDREVGSLQILKMLTEDTQSVQFEKRYLRKNGSILWANVNSVLLTDNNGEPQCFAKQIVDISERVETEKQLKDAEQRYRAIIEQSLVGFYIFTEDRYQFVNQRFCDIFGYSKEEILGTIKPTDVLRPDYQEMARQYIAERLEGKTKTVHYTAAGNHKSGKELWVEIQGSVIQTNDGAVITGTILDVTATKKAETELIQINENLRNILEGADMSVSGLNLGVSRNQIILMTSIRELKNKYELLIKTTAELTIRNEELQAFSFTVSHDLKAPLRAISNFSRYLREDYSKSLGDEGTRLVSVIEDNVTQMQEMITDLLRLSALSHHHLEYVDTETQSMVIDVFNTLMEEERSFGEVFFNAKDLPNVRLDCILFREIWSNLISNGLKYSRNQVNRSLEIGCKESVTHWTFWIKDNGIGFDPKYHDKIFGIFERLHTLEEYEGTGVGLAIARRIVIHHNGEIWAESQPGAGATFFFTIPRQPSDPLFH